MPFKGGIIMGIKQTLVSFMKETAYSPMDLEELCAVFDIQPNEYKAFKKTLRTMEAEGLIVKTKRDRYKVAGKEEIIMMVLLLELQKYIKEGLVFLFQMKKDRKMYLYQAML